jgi:5-methyltetrahydrofolate--homocysteine methyltransferase
VLIIGERINATNKKVARAIRERDSLFIQGMASAQIAAGANYLDVNAGAGGSGNEEELMEWLVDTVQAVSNKALVIDSAEPKVVEAGLRRCQDRTAIINSITAEPRRLEALSPLVVDYDAEVIALAMDEGGISDSTEGRINACDRIAQRLTALGIPLHKILFDPMVLPIGVDSKLGITTLNTLEQIKSRYIQARTTLGLSNISYALPNREIINRTFLIMAMYAGLDSAIVDPLDSKLMNSIKVGEMLLGRDSFCKDYLAAHRRAQFKE